MSENWQGRVVGGGGHGSGDAPSEQELRRQRRARWWDRRLAQAGLARRARLRETQSRLASAEAAADYWQAVARSRPLPRRPPSAQSAGHASGTGAGAGSGPRPGPGAAGPAAVSPDAEAVLADVTRGLISVVERLAEIGGSADHAAVLEILHRHLIRLVAACGAAEFRDHDRVDPLRHEVVATVPAPTRELDGRISETVRSGYLWRGALLRPQQVVAYSAGSGPAGGRAAAPDGSAA